MKTKILILACSLYFLTLSTANAEDLKKIPVKDILETSLMGLKNSVQKIEVRNQWLMAQIENMQSQMKGLQADYKKIASWKEKSVHEMHEIKPVAVKKQIVEEEKPVVLGKNLEQLSEEQAKLEQELESRKQDDQSIQSQLSQLEQEIAQLKEQRKLSKKPTSFTKNPELAQLSQNIEEGERNIALSKKKLRQLSQSMVKSVDMKTTLEAEIASLKQSNSSLEDEYKIALEEEKSISSEMEGLKKQNEDQMTQLNQEIDKLSTKNKDLAQTLSQAKDKLHDTQLSAANSEQEELQLRQNLALIQKENFDLKNAFSKLEKKNAELKIQ